MAFKIYRRLDDSLLFIENRGLFFQAQTSFTANNADRIICNHCNSELFDIHYSEILKEDDSVAGSDQVEVLSYLDTQLISVERSGRYTNTDTVTDLHVTAADFLNTFVPIFGTTDQASALYTVLNATSLQINHTASYLISFSFDLETTVTDAALAMRLTLNGNSEVGPIVTCTFHNTLSSTNKKTIQLTTTLNLNKDDVLQIGARQLNALVCSVTFSDAATSYFNIMRL